MNNNCQNLNNKDFMLNQYSRPIYDTCEFNVEKSNYKKISDRLTENFHDCGCAAPNVTNLAYSQPELQFNDGYGFTSMDGCNIDADSEAKMGKDAFLLPEISTCPFNLQGPCTINFSMIIL